MDTDKSSPAFPMPLPAKTLRAIQPNTATNNNPSVERNKPSHVQETTLVDVQNQLGESDSQHVNNDCHEQLRSSSATLKHSLGIAEKAPESNHGQFATPSNAIFRREQILLEREVRTEEEQAKDLKVKTRVRMAKFGLRGVTFSCNLIVLSMAAASISIFNATRTLSGQDKFAAWSSTTDTSPQVITLIAACISLIICILIFIRYCRTGHRGAKRIRRHYIFFSIGWFIFSIAIWAWAAAILLRSRSSDTKKGLWGWSCRHNDRTRFFHDKVDFALVCRLQMWTLVCVIIDIVIDTISVILYLVVFYRLYSKHRLAKSMGMRDRARSDLYQTHLDTDRSSDTSKFAHLAGSPHQQWDQDSKIEHDVSIPERSAARFPAADTNEKGTIPHDEYRYSNVAIPQAYTTLAIKHIRPHR